MPRPRKKKFIALPMATVHYPEILVTHPSPNDVLFGRGGETNGFPGNVEFRDLVLQAKPRYDALNKNDKRKRNIAHGVILAVAARGGRFLDRKKADQTWYVVTDIDRIRTKVMQGLRDPKEEEARERRQARSAAKKRSKDEQDDDGTQTPKKRVRRKKKKDNSSSVEAMREVRQSRAAAAAKKPSKDEQDDGAQTPKKLAHRKKKDNSSFDSRMEAVMLMEDDALLFDAISKELSFDATSNDFFGTATPPPSSPPRLKDDHPGEDDFWSMATPPPSSPPRLKDDHPGEVATNMSNEPAIAPGTEGVVDSPTMPSIAQKVFLKNPPPLADAATAPAPSPPTVEVLFEGFPPTQPPLSAAAVARASGSTSSLSWDEHTATLTVNSEFMFYNLGGNDGAPQLTFMQGHMMEHAQHPRVNTNVATDAPLPGKTEDSSDTFSISNLSPLSYHSIGDIDIEPL